MAIILRKAGSAPVRVVAPPPPVPDETAYQSPFKESYHSEGAESGRLPAEAVAPPAALPAATPVTPLAIGKPKAVFKIIPGKPLRPGLPPPSAPPVDRSIPDAALVKAGVLEPHELTNAEMYPPVGPGEFVVITNTMFPWVKHYKPGDIARVRFSSPAHSHVEDPIYKYRAYFLEIVEGPRKGQTPMLWRWEFEPRRDCQPAPKIEGRMITQS